MTHYNFTSRMKSMIMLVIILMCEAVIVKSQTTFLKTYGGKYDEQMNRMIQSHDGGFMMVGNTISYGGGNFGNTEDYIVKTDSAGNILWSRTLGLQSYDDIYSIEATDDSTYVICGIASDNNTYIGMLLAKISESGNVLWQKVIEPDHAAMGYCVRQTTDGGLIVAGEILLNDNLDFLLMKTDADGNVQWSKEIGSADVDFPSYVMQTEDGGYFVCGVSRENSATMPVYAVKTDSNGIVEWQKTYRTSPPFSRSTVSKVLKTSDGGYLIAGGNTHNELFSDIMLLRIDSSGEVKWTKAYGGDQDEFCGSIIQNNEGNYVVCGATASSASTGYDDALIMLIDSSGDLINSSVFGKTFAEDNFVSVTPLGQEGYMLGGSSSSFNSLEFSDFMLMKVDKNLNGAACDTLQPNIIQSNFFLDDTTDVNETDITISDSDVAAVIDSGAKDSLLCDVATESVEPPSKQSELNVYPNPTTESFVISFRDESLLNEPVTIQMVNSQGQIVYSVQEIVSAFGLKKEISLSQSLAAGIYSVQIIGKEKILTTKLVVLKQ